MAVELDKVDVIRERMTVGYADAQRALEQAEGDLVKALALVEQWLKEREKDASLTHLVEEAVEELQQAAKARVRKIRVRVGKRWVREFPVALTAAAAIGVTLVAFLINRCAIEVERETSQDDG